MRHRHVLDMNVSANPWVVSDNFCHDHNSHVVNTTSDVSVDKHFKTNVSLDHKNGFWTISLKTMCRALKGKNRRKLSCSESNVTRTQNMNKMKVIADRFSIVLVISPIRVSKSDKASFRMPLEEFGNNF